jgi:SAM-dependent methyltransferase
MSPKSSNIFDTPANVDMLARQWASEEEDGSDSVKVCAELLDDIFYTAESRTTIDGNIEAWLPSITVLDVGCGLGRLEKILPEDARYLGVDQSHEMVARCREDGLLVEQGSVYDLPFEDQCFDAVACNAVLFHVGDIPRAMAELWRVTRKRLVVSLYWKRGLIHKGAQPVWAEDATTPGFWSVQNVVPRWMVKRLAHKFGARKVSFHWREDIGLWREKVVFVVLER